jgi:hypothetical protein
MEEFILSGFKGPGCLVARMDYGFPPVRLPEWREADLGRSDLVEALPGTVEGGLILRRAELLQGWSRTRSGPALWRMLKAQADAGGLVLECRFPKHARSLLKKLRSEGARFLLWETPASGQIPPLYAELAPQPGLLKLHLEHEWWTAMGAARGGVALLRIAVALATQGSATSQDLAQRLSITSGAVRSYLNWMEDVALIRREGRRAALRHPLLAALFEPHRPQHEPHISESSPREKAWDPVELD